MAMRYCKDCQFYECCMRTPFGGCQEFDNVAANPTKPMTLEEAKQLLKMEFDWDWEKFRREAVKEYEKRVIEETKCHHNALLTYANGYEDALLLIPGAFIAGAKWQAEQAQETIELAEDHAYLAGAEWQKEQMMKEAVEGKVVKDINNKLSVTAKNVNLDKFKFGDKVRIIIIKEDKS